MSLNLYAIHHWDMSIFYPRFKCNLSQGSEELSSQFNLLVVLCCIVAVGRQGLRVDILLTNKDLL
jgi:hypothetical protein